MEAGNTVSVNIQSENKISLEIVGERDVHIKNTGRAIIGLSILPSAATGNANVSGEVTTETSGEMATEAVATDTS